VFLSASSQQYWNRSGSDTFYQAGYTNSFKYGTYSITAGRTRDSDGSMENQFMVSATIPLGHSQHSPLLSTNLSSTGGAANMQANVSGSLGITTSTHTTRMAPITPPAVAVRRMRV